MRNKQFVLLLVISATILIQACKKDTGAYPMTLEERIKNSSGMVKATLNDKPWLSTVTRAYNWNGRVGFVAQYYLNDDLNEELSLSNINPLLQLHSIRYQNPATYEYGNAGGAEALFGIVEVDADIAAYHVIPDSLTNDYVEITSYNDVTHEIQGRFQISFYRTYSVDEGVYDTVRFTDGAFSLKIK